MCLNYLTNRLLLEKEGIVCGLDRLPSNYEKLSIHDSNNQYMITMWEIDNSHLEEVLLNYKGWGNDYGVKNE